MAAFNFSSLSYWMQPMRGESGHIRGTGRLVNMKYHLKPRHCDLVSTATENVVFVVYKSVKWVSAKAWCTSQAITSASVC